MKTVFLLLLLIFSANRLGCDKPAAQPKPDYDKYPLTEQAVMAANTGDTALLKEVLAKGIDPNWFSPEGVPLLQLCLGPHGSNESVKLLIEKGADINQVSIYGDTALMEACMWLNEEIIEVLLKKGANPNAQNNDGETPLHRMGSAGKSTINSVKLLVEAGAKLDLKRKNGETILQHFSKFESKLNDELISYLKSHGAS